MSAARMQAFVSLLLALLIAMLVAVVEGGAVARADTPAAHSDTRSDAASAAQNDWEQDPSSGDRADSAERTDASDDEDDDADTREEAQDRRSVEEYFDWDSDFGVTLSAAATRVMTGTRAAMISSISATIRICPRERMPTASYRSSAPSVTRATPKTWSPSWAIPRRAGT